MSRVAPIVSVNHSQLFNFNKKADDQVELNNKNKQLIDQAANVVLQSESLAIEASKIKGSVASLKASDNKENSLQYVAKAIADMKAFIQAVEPALKSANIKPADTKLPNDLDRDFR